MAKISVADQVGRLSEVESGELAVGAFRPYEVDRSAQRWVGTILRVNAIHATIPTDLLPGRVWISSTYTKTATPWREYFAQHEGGQISLPSKPGDGGPSLRQLLDWLARQGYREAADSGPGRLVYERD